MIHLKHVLLKVMLLGFFAMFVQFAAAQKKVSGLWEGKLTQNEGSLWTEYNFKIMISQNKKDLTGECSVVVDKIYANMEFAGKIDGNKVHLEEKTLLKHTEREDLEWCLKVIDLTFTVKNNTEVLEGTWTGRTKQGTVCIPGKIYLKKGIIRA